MITQDVDSFILGVDRYPEWFKTYQVEYSLDHSGSLVAAFIATPQGIIKANTGDAIMRKQGWLYAIPKEAAKRYMTHENS